MKESINKPSLSIIVPVYNVEKYLDKCLQSIINQDYTDFEVILINDGSTDGSAKICENITQQDNRFLYFYKDNGGTYSARNYGLKKANGKYIAFIDSDDIINKYFCSTMINLIEQNDADISSCSYMDFFEYNIDINEYKKAHNVEIYKKNDVLKEYFQPKGNHIYLNVTFKIFKKDLFNGLVFEDYKLEDLFMLYKLLDRANTIVTIDNKLYYYNRNNINSKTYTINNEKRICERKNYISMVHNYFSNRKEIKKELDFHIIEQNIVLLNEIKMDNSKSYSNEIPNIKKWIISNIVNNPFDLKQKVKFTLQAFFPKLFRLYRKKLIKD